MYLGWGRGKRHHYRRRWYGGYLKQKGRNKNLKSSCEQRLVRDVIFLLAQIIPALRAFFPSSIFPICGRKLYNLFLVKSLRIQYGSLPPIPSLLTPKPASHATDNPSTPVSHLISPKTPPIHAITSLFPNPNPAPAPSSSSDSSAPPHTTASPAPSPATPSAAPHTRQTDT